MQSGDPGFAQQNLRLVRIRTLCITYIHEAVVNIHSYYMYVCTKSNSAALKGIVIHNIDCASNLNSIAKMASCSHYFLHGASGSLHHIHSGECFYACFT